MTKEQLAALAAAALVVTVAIVMQKDAPPDLDKSTAKLARASDGGKAYLVETATGDVLLDAAPCVRRRKGSAPGSCLMHFDKRDIDMGELSRFPASVASGPDCEPVACSVTGAENADDSEDVALDKVQRIETPVKVDVAPVEEALP